MPDTPRPTPEKEQVLRWFAREHGIPSLGEGVNFRLVGHPPDGDYTVPVVRGEHTVKVKVRIKKGEVTVDPDNPGRPVDTFNRFMIGVRDDLVIHHIPYRALDKEEALLAAAYLVVCADPDGARFARVLETVRGA
jgi:hypothetical protein